VLADAVVKAGMYTAISRAENTPPGEALTKLRAEVKARQEADPDFTKNLDKGGKQLEVIVTEVAKALWALRRAFSAGDITACIPAFTTASANTFYALWKNKLLAKVPSDCTKEQMTAFAPFAEIESRARREGRDSR